MKEINSQKQTKSKGENCLSCQKKISQKDYREHHYGVRDEGIYCQKCGPSNGEEKEKNTEIKEVNNGEELIKNYPCSSCDYEFIEKDLKEKNYQVSYSVDKYGTQKDPCQEVKEIYDIKHLDCLGSCGCSKCKRAHEELKKYSATCFICRKNLENLVIISRMSESPYHLECGENKKPSSVLYKWHIHPKLLKLKIQAKKITAFLDDKREISILISELAKRGVKPNLKTEQLKKYEIDSGGHGLRFPKIDVDVSVQLFLDGKCGCC